MLPFTNAALLFGAGGPPAGTFLVGNNAAQTTNTGAFGDIQQGIGAQASVSGTANSIVIIGSSAASFPTAMFRCCVYAATSATVWSGALLGKTADITGIGTSEVKSIPLIAPVSIVSGNWYALTVHCRDNISNQSNGSFADRFFSDTFSDGPLNPASASGANSPNGRIIYLTT